MLTLVVCQNQSTSFSEFLSSKTPIFKNLFSRMFVKTLEPVLYHFVAQESGANHYANAVIVVVTQHTSTMGPFKLSSNQFISELGISLQLACV